MPFDFKEYQAKCDGMSTEELHKEMGSYTRQLSGGATSTATSILLAPYTGGVSLVGLGLAAPKVHNARKKREIIEAGLKARGATHNTRKRDVIAPMAVTGAINGLTMGLAGPIAGTVAGQVVGHGVEYATSHVALDAGGNLIEHQHEKYQKLKAEARLHAQYGSFKVQYAHEQASMQCSQSPVAGYQPGLQIPGSIQGHQTASPQASTGFNLPGPPPLRLQSSPQHQNYEPAAAPASYDTGPQQIVTQQQVSFHAGAAFHFQTQQSFSNNQSNSASQQVSSPQSQQSAPVQQSAPYTGYPAERPLVMSGPSSTTPLFPYATTNVSQPWSPSLQHRPSLPTPNITSHTPVHRPSLPTSPQDGTSPNGQAFPASNSEGNTASAQTEAMLSMKEEITFLRLKIVAMELERRGEPVVTAVKECDDEDDEEQKDDGQSKSPQIPETFPIETWAPEPARRATQDSNAVTSPTVASPNGSSSPKLNVFVDLQQPKPQHVIRPPQELSATQVVPYPTFSNSQPERQHYQVPTSHFHAPSIAPALNQESSKTGLSITGGISLTYNRDSTNSQAAPATLAPNIVHRPASVPPQHSQFSTISLPSQAPQQQSSTSYQTYTPQHKPSVPISPQQHAPTQGEIVPYRPALPSQQLNNGLQTYSPNQQATNLNTQPQQQAYSQPTKQPPPLQHQDSGYYSNPSSRHSSTFSLSANASLNVNHSQQTISSSIPAFSPTNAQSPGSPQQYVPANHSPYGQMPTTYTPSPMSPSSQQYFPPPPGNAPPPSKDYFGKNRVSTSNPQVQGYQQTLPAPPGPNYGNVQNGHGYQSPPPPAPIYGGQQGGNNNQGWQWGNANAGAPGEPNYGAPPPIPGKWRGS